MPESDLLKQITKLQTQNSELLAKDEIRNQQIATDVLEAIASGRTPIILTQRKEHVMQLASIIENQTDLFAHLGRFFLQ